MRKYHNQTIHGPFPKHSGFSISSCSKRDNGRVCRAAVMSFNQLLDQWLSTVVKA